ncbi:denticleless protein-like [Heracleum sosnowskyi]|uniref:Denticleless protein-like n=1 Tax=Heracleum sosnowskyi TaxID=360622 RepID=A0AAD8H4A2_9APIA|nr:denticleless protein-like [Heracleum sosnowskyi]
METSKPHSFFQDIKSRELNGFRVRKRPCIQNDAFQYKQIGVVSVEHNGDPSPPMALSFCKTSKNAHIIAVTDELGYVSLYNTRFNTTSSSTSGHNSEKAKLWEWVAHDNAIFDICWIKDDTNILTASGDQSIKLWDAEEKKCLGVLIGHTGSIKSICSHPTNPDIILSGSRDGSFALWDLRCSGSKQGAISKISPVAMKEAYSSSYKRRARPVKASSKSITSVLYLKDELSIATAGATDSVVKFWDSRKLKAPVSQACSDDRLSTQQERRLYGITSLSQDINGVFISASCMDNTVYLYNILQLEKGPVKSFSGCRIGSFFVKSAMSPDAAHILAGSSDGNAYIWQVNTPKAEPIVLKGHDGETTAVDWSPSETGKIATSSDDFTVRFWDIRSSCYSKTRSPCSVRRRVMALPSIQCRKLFMDEEPTISKLKPDTCPNDEAMNPINSSITESVPEVSTPKPLKRRFLSPSKGNESFEQTPEAFHESPSSVLNPPSSLKRKTIRDYFLATS